MKNEDIFGGKMNLYSNREEDGITFNQQSQVYFSQCTKNRTLSINELLRLTSDIAVEEYRDCGLSREFLLEKGFAILVSRVSFKIFRMPRENEKICISTWEEKAEALQLKRGYKITCVDNKNEVLVLGLSAWLLVNPELRKIIPTKNFTLRNPSSIQREYPGEKLGKISIPQELTHLASRTIQFSDIDANGHTNNSRYASFIIDSLPEDFQNKDFTDLRLNYSKEAMLGQKLDIFANIEPSLKQITILGKTEEGTSFESVLRYR